MRVGLGSDHRGTEEIGRIADQLKRLGHEPLPMGVSNDKSSDYPDMAWPVALAVSRGEIERGILLDGTGIGMCITANKLVGVRAALVHDEIGADLSRRHNDSNILCLSADMLGHRIIERIVAAWMAAPFDGGRHARRVNKIRAIEAGRPPDQVGDPGANNDPVNP